MSKEELAIADRITRSWAEVERRRMSLRRWHRTRNTRRTPRSTQRMFDPIVSMRHRRNNAHYWPGTSLFELDNIPRATSRNLGRYVGANIQGYLGHIRRRRIGAALARTRSTRVARARRTSIRRVARSGIRGGARRSRAPWGHIQSYL